MFEFINSLNNTLKTHILVFYMIYGLFERYEFEFGQKYFFLQQKHIINCIYKRKK